jgi:glycosyltransferase involved in cell wall biosynthesis
MDYGALAEALEAAGSEVELLGFAELDACAHPLVKALARADRDAALALMGFLCSHRFDAVFTNSESVGIPLSLLLRGRRRRPRHVTIAHRPSTGKKRVFWKSLQAWREIDTIFVYATAQKTCCIEALGIPPERVEHIHFHADTRFFRPQPDTPVHPDQICSAGLEWRDYPTLIAAVESLPRVCVKLAAASPWSKHRNETAERPLPKNVTAQRYDYGALRTLYAESAFVVVPLYDNDFQAGITTILEAMATQKAVIVTQTLGQTDVILHGENGLVVGPGDTEGWQKSIQLLCEDSALRDRLARNAHRWVAENATLDQWTGKICQALLMKKEHLS